MINRRHRSFLFYHDWWRKRSQPQHVTGLDFWLKEKSHNESFTSEILQMFSFANWRVSSFLTFFKGLCLTLISKKTQSCLASRYKRTSVTSFWAPVWIKCVKENQLIVGIKMNFYAYMICSRSACDLTAFGDCLRLQAKELLRNFRTDSVRSQLLFVDWKSWYKKRHLLSFSIFCVFILFCLILCDFLCLWEC